MSDLRRALRESTRIELCTVRERLLKMDPLTTTIGYRGNTAHY
jgi:hypothetical protein